MSSSQEVFKKRREGLLDEAYQIALQRMSAPDKGEWDDKALGWCLVDLIKRCVNSGQLDYLPHYRKQLQEIDVPASDDVLTKQRQFALTLCNPSGQLANQARNLSKAGQHVEAVNLYKRASYEDPDNQSLHTSLGWELYRIAKAKLEETPLDAHSVKLMLNEYLKLRHEKPSLLHSCILQLAYRLAVDNKINMPAFCRIWGVENLREQDWERFTKDDGKEVSSLAEKIIQKGCKEAAKADDRGFLTYIFPFLDEAIAKFPDNVWLSLSKAKLLLVLERKDEAIKFAINVVKVKPTEYWCWELLGDIFSGSGEGAALSCYCKALLCSDDDHFVGKLRLKLSRILLERGDLPEAKHEIERVIQSKVREGSKVPRYAAMLASQEWYSKIEPAESNRQFYLENKMEAEEVIYDEIPWISACLGDEFTVNGKDGKAKKRRRLYIDLGSYPFEVIIPESKVSLVRCDVGTPLSIKGEWDAHRHFQIYLVSPRQDGNEFDIFSEHVGVVDHVNFEKKLIHYIVRKDVDGVIPFSALDSEFSVGDPIALKVAVYTSKQGRRYRAISTKGTEKEPPLTLKKSFEEELSISGELGFTSSRVFVPPPLVKREGLQDGDVVSGTALLSYDKKRSEWSWKAISINKSDFSKNG